MYDKLEFLLKVQKKHSLQKKSKRNKNKKKKENKPQPKGAH